MSELDDLKKRVSDLEDENLRLKTEKDAYHTNLESLVRERANQLQSTMQSLERSYDMTLEVMGKALELKEAPTVGHARRVTLVSIAIGKAMGLRRDQVAIIARGAFLHDVGKMATPDAILHKPAVLSPEEIAIMREHPLRGYLMLQMIPFLKEAAEIVYAHHERFDGTGYPRGMKCMEIPVGARIVAIANTLDSITSDLPHRPARSIGMAREEIRCCTRTQFDPEIVDVFLKVPVKTWENLHNEAEAAQTHS